MPHSRNSEISLPYRELIKDTLSFKNLGDTENCLSRLENLRQRFLAASDKEGMAACRLIALRGRKRAEMVSRNLRVSLRKRKEKREIALWFQIWLENPEIFQDWLALRKRTETYQRLTG